MKVVYQNSHKMLTVERILDVQDKNPELQAIWVRGELKGEYPYAEPYTPKTDKDEKDKNSELAQNLVSHLKRDVTYRTMIVLHRENQDLILGLSEERDESKLVGMAMKHIPS